MEKLLLRADEVAVVMSVSRSTVYNLLASGEIPSVSVGGNKRVPAEWLKEWVASRLKPISG